ncbi:DNA-formamidopyrimidine glycosylase [Rubeoparvulum massiliense]|uniref:DNA-formamidopyrimidine glycosylase n=1 Tax=Rubeoparvulum massiliense TaxID=1631346 RepID=UPI00065E5660|nr:DNA-formamidopyrimidine glycosylase [Rubeoparvulum massiliense]
MPELPEVENVRRTLLPLVKEKIIETVEVRCPRIIRTPDDIMQFAHELEDKEIMDIERRGKYLIFILSEGYALVSHLRMEGKYWFVNHDQPYGKHEHVIFHFHGEEKELRYEDVRKFGTMDMILQSDLPSFPALAKLGPEPLDPVFTWLKLKEQLAGKGTNIKAALLDQQVVAGLGNIYVDESLAMAHLHPTRPVPSLNDGELQLLHEAIQVIIKKAIVMEGSTIRSYANMGKKGLMQEELLVYGRTGEPCKYCGHPIEKRIVAGRGTHFCPACQPE